MMAAPRLSLRWPWFCLAALAALIPAGPAPLCAADAAGGATVAAVAASDSRALLEEADAALKAGRMAQAAALLNQLNGPAHRPYADAVQLLTAEYAISQNRLADADAALARMTEVPGNSISGISPCRLAMAQAWLALRRDDRAAARARLALPLAQCPDDAGAWNLLALVEQQHGHGAASEAAYRTALALAPADVMLINNYALLLAAEKRAEEARQWLDRALNLAPEDSPARRLTQEHRDYVGGMLNQRPVRSGENDAEWSQRLERHGDGARASGHAAMARALYTAAIHAAPAYPRGIWDKLARLDVSARQEAAIQGNGITE